MTIGLNEKKTLPPVLRVVPAETALLFESYQEEGQKSETGESYSRWCLV